MLKRAGHTVVFGSVKLDLGREIVRKEAEAMQKAIAMLAAQAGVYGFHMEARPERLKAVPYANGTTDPSGFNGVPVASDIASTGSLERFIYPVKPGTSAPQKKAPEVDSPRGLLFLTVSAGTPSRFRL